MSMNNGGVFARDGYGSVTTSFDDVLYSPEMDDLLDNRLEDARQSRTGFYRKMLASRSRPLDDYSVSKKISYRSGNSPAKEPSISDTAPAGPLPQIPEPHSSWRFYTSYDNGEWKRHAVPVHKEEEEILREPSKNVRRLRESERSTYSPPVESTLRKMRQSGGPLVACLQPRPRRSSEGQKTTTTVHTVNGQPSFVGGELGGQFVLPADWEQICANGTVVRRFSDGGTEYLVLEQDPVQGSVRQECTTKYTSTVKVTQPNGGHLLGSGVSGEQAVGVARGGGVGDGQGVAAGESGERKSRRPRIYGFEEKIIIPTKYKNAENQEGGEGRAEKANDINSGQSGSRIDETREEKSGKKGSLAEDGLKFKERGVGAREVVERVQTTDASQIGAPEGSRHLSAGSVAQDRPLQGTTVKVVVMNSSSDGESEKKSVEPLSSEEDKEVRDNSPARKLNTGQPEGLFQLPNLFQDGPLPIEGIRALHESLHANLLPTVSPVMDAGSIAAIEDRTSVNPNQRVFSKDEQTFSEVGPDGAKCDGKVLRTYEVITTTNEDDSTIQKRLPAPTKEVVVVPIEAAERSPFQTRSISATVIEDGTTNTNRLGQIVSHLPQQQETRSRHKAVSTVSPKADDQKKAATDIFEQTGSLFKTITPRPRNVREKESAFAAREEHLRKAAGESAQPKLGGFTRTTTTTVRTSANQRDGLRRESDPSEKASSNVVTSERVRTKIVYASNEDRSSSPLRPSGSSAEARVSLGDSLGTFATSEDRGSSQSNTNSGVLLQGWSDKAETKKSNLKTMGNEREWDVQVALKD